MIKKLVLVLLLMVMVGCGGGGEGTSGDPTFDIPWDDVVITPPPSLPDCGLEQDQYGNWWNTCG